MFDFRSVWIENFYDIQNNFLNKPTEFLLFESDNEYFVNFIGSQYYYFDSATRKTYIIYKFSYQLVYYIFNFFLVSEK